MRPGLFYYIIEVVVNWLQADMKNSDAALKGDENTKGQSAPQSADRQQKLAEARALIRKYIPEGRSLADELIQERREAAKLES